MHNDVMSLPEEIPVLQHFIEQAEFHRDEQSLDVLRKYWNCHIGSLLPLTQTLSEGVFEQIIHYLGAGDEGSKVILRQKYQALWEVFMHENKSGIVGFLLIKEIVMSYMLLEFCTEKLVRFFTYASSKEGRLMESLQTRYIKSLKTFQKVNGKLPPMAMHVTQINVETFAKGQQAYGPSV
jgi:hypothetical protein